MPVAFYAAGQRPVRQLLFRADSGIPSGMSVENRDADARRRALEIEAERHRRGEEMAKRKLAKLACDNACDKQNPSDQSND